MLELHGSLVHQLSVAALQLMSHTNSRDVNELREVLDRVARSLNAALAELRLLLRLQREDSARARRWIEEDELADLAAPVDPSAAAARWSERLVRAGFDPTVTVPDEIDLLPLSSRTTIVRGMDAACDTIISHAVAGSACAIVVGLEPSQIVLRVRGSLVGSSVPSMAARRRFDALRQRVDLTGGTLCLRPSTTEPAVEWLVMLSVPRAQ